MNEEAQRIAIANACNWTQHGDEGVYGCWDDPNQITRTDCPDYLNDLNAMHSAVASQGEMFQVGFAGALSARAGMLGKWTHQLTAKDWADCFIVVLQSKRDGGK